jgi:hypothetical protein
MLLRWRMAFVLLVGIASQASCVWGQTLAVEPLTTDEADAYFADTTASDLELELLDGASAEAAEKQQRAALNKAINSAYAPLFFNNKFEYLDNPLYDQWFLGDRLKQLHGGCCDDWTVDVGGQFRLRQQAERNFRGLGLTGRDDDFLLYRTRLFANAKYRDKVRIYAEGIDAESNYEEFGPRAIEVNRTDMLNLFADAMVYQCDDRSLTVRAGRQELLYGAQRLVSPLDWSNTRRTFEGVNFLWRGDDWNIDAFFVEPVLTHPEKFDSAVDEAEFMGVYGTYKSIPNQTVDLFAIQFNNALAPRNFQYTTLGGRWQGSREQWLWEGEGGVQFGDNTDGSNHSAGYWTVGGGHKWEHCWKPTLWLYYDWASGGNVRGAGQGFDHLFPLGHRYLGYMDLFARSNIESPNAQFTFSPCSDVNVLIWYYYLFLENGVDTPYNVNMIPYQPGHTPPSRELGTRDRPHRAVRDQSPDGSAG